MDVLTTFVKEFLLPGSPLLLILLGSLCTVLLFGGSRTRRLGRAGWLALLIVYWLLALPIVSGALESMLQGDYQPITDPAKLQGTQAIVVLSGGSSTYRASGAGIDALSEASALRTIEAARLYRVADPAWVILSGGVPDGQDGASTEAQALQAALLNLGVPGDRILLENVSGDTHAQAVNLTGFLRQHEIERFILVTSPSHMRRSMLVFEAQGLHPSPSVAVGHSELGEGSLRSWLPSEDGLSDSKAAMREVLALGYYAGRGWLAPADS
jgi:uncharacterized SAM-binding protein YcdF (DUF218 family)